MPAENTAYRLPEAGGTAENDRLRTLTGWESGAGRTVPRGRLQGFGQSADRLAVVVEELRGLVRRQPPFQLTALGLVPPGPVKWRLVGGSCPEHLPPVDRLRSAPALHAAEKHSGP